MSRWELLAGPSTAAPTGQLTEARSRKLVFKLAEPSTIGFTIDGRHEQAYDVLELATDIHAVRDGVPLLTTRVTATSDDFDSASHTTTVAAVDTRGLLARRMTQSARTWAGVDVTTAYAALIGDVQTSPNTPLGITMPARAPSGITVSRDIKTGIPLLGELQALAGGTDAGASVFDWDISPGWPGAPAGWDGTPARTAQLWTPSRGRDLTGATDRTTAVVLDYTWRGGQPRNSPIARVRRSFDPASYANLIIVTGGTFQTQVQVPAAAGVESAERVVRGLAGVAEGNPILTKFVRRDDRKTKKLDDDLDVYDATITTTPVTLADGRTIWDIGTYAVAISDPDLTTQAAVNARAAQLAVDLAAVTPTYDVTLVDGFWQGPAHIWLGDKARLVLDSGRLNEDASLRVQAITVDPGDDGSESVTLTVGPTLRTDLSLLLAHARRLAALERRV